MILKLGKYIYDIYPQNRLYNLIFDRNLCKGEKIVKDIRKKVDL